MESSLSHVLAVTFSPPPLLPGIQRTLAPALLLVKLPPRPTGQQDHLVLRHGELPVVVSPSGQQQVSLLVGEDGRPVRPVARIVRVHDTLGLQGAELEDQQEEEQELLLHPWITVG